MDVVSIIVGLGLLFGVVFTVIFIRVYITTKAETARAEREAAAQFSVPQHPSPAPHRYGVDDAPPPPPPGW
jgi:hypothetical protein